ncbi:hypothetical protein OHB14_34940 [Streptomyces sp. NBC_01613]|uniref:hypothetical protein n=1 Tax=Streptomyces sp. NBC_01613 TaxID=2975896 RepID=UPI003865F99B
MVIQLVIGIFFMGLDQLAQSRFGAIGLLFLLLLGVGIRTRNGTCMSVAAVVLVLMIQA